MKDERVHIVTEEGISVEALAPVVLSVSRATDIPAFYASWFFDRLGKGYCRWRNPFNGRDSYVSLSNVRFVVFWSKNPAPLIPYLHILRERGIGCYVQYTLNDYVSENLEPGVPSLDERISSFRHLVEVLGKGHVVWRFDPLILTDSVDMEKLLLKIEGIGNRLKHLTEKMVFSFADISVYRRVASNLTNHGVKYLEWTEPAMCRLAKTLASLNQDNGWNYDLATCGEWIDLSMFGISHNRCIDDELIARLAWHDKGLMEYLGIKIEPKVQTLFGDNELPGDAFSVTENLYGRHMRNNRDTGQRKACGCIKAKDIGQYNTCPHGCLYCYANTSPASALACHKRHSAHNENIV